MTKKCEILVGATLRVTSKAGDGWSLLLTKEPGGGLSGGINPACGDLLVVVSPARKYQGINCVEVSWNGSNWFAYYNGVRYKTVLA